MESSVSDNEGMRERTLREPDLSPGIATYAPGYSCHLQWLYDSCPSEFGEVDGLKFSSDGAHFGDGRNSYL